MKHSTGAPTKAQQKRFEIIFELGCVACILRGIHKNPPQIHHIVEGKKRLGHDYTLALCPFHHEGQVPTGFTYEQVKARIGPSYAKEPRLFKEEFGTQRELLEFQNTLLDHYYKVQGDEE